MPTQTVKKLPGKQVPMLKSRISTRQLKLNKDAADEDGVVSVNTNWMKRKSSIWPIDNQNPYIDKELQEEVSLSLTCDNPQQQKNLVEFSYKDGAFIPVTITDQHITLINIEGTSFHVDSQEAKDQIQISRFDQGVQDKTERAREENNEDDVSSEKDVVEDETTGDEADDEDLQDVKSERNDSVSHESAKRTKKLMNQFNFCERATLTYNNPLKDVGTQTTPPSRSRFNNYVTQWIIFDSYKEDYELQQIQKEEERKEKLTVQCSKKEDVKKMSNAESNDTLTTSMLRASLLLERMINQNMFDDILHDFRYYEDPSDEYRGHEGTLLPLWMFQYQNSKKLNITDIRWNPLYYDMFAVALGSFDFQKQSTIGYFCIWSLKNPSHPEYVNTVECGVMSLDFHHSHQNLIVVGLYDGGVAVYDIKNVAKTPLYKSDNVSKKHNGIVWQVQWGQDLGDAEMTFYSISSDGRVFSWLLMQNDLSQTLVVNLFLDMEHIDLIDQSSIMLKGIGTCMTFHPKDGSMFLVGTEEGYICKCSTAYTSTYLFIYKAHNMPVHRLDYNKYSSEIFASCSADWCIKIWEDERREPLFVFDLGCSVSDVKWAPYSSTVLAAITTDCKVHIFDLNVDKYKAICVQSVSSKKHHKFTRIAFNWKLPIIVAGNNRGCAMLLKLSPNLRLKPKISKKQQAITPIELEIIKLEKVLSLVRDPSGFSKAGNLTSTDTSSV